MSDRPSTPNAPHSSPSPDGLPSASTRLGPARPVSDTDSTTERTTADSKTSKSKDDDDKTATTSRGVVSTARSLIIDADDDTMPSNRNTKATHDATSAAAVVVTRTTAAIVVADASSSPARGIPTASIIRPIAVVTSVTPISSQPTRRPLPASTSTTCNDARCSLPADQAALNNTNADSATATADSLAKTNKALSTAAISAIVLVILLITLGALLLIPKIRHRMRRSSRRAAVARRMSLAPSTVATPELGNDNAAMFDTRMARASRLYNDEKAGSANNHPGFQDNADNEKSIGMDYLRSEALYASQGAAYGYYADVKQASALGQPFQQGAHQQQQPQQQSQSPQSDLMVQSPVFHAQTTPTQHPISLSPGQYINNNSPYHACVIASPSLSPDMRNQTRETVLPYTVGWASNAIEELRALGSPPPVNYSYG